MSRAAASRARPAPALLQAAAETTGVWGRKKAVRRVRHCEEVGVQEWPLAGRATVPRVLYGTGPRMSLRQRTILSKSLPAPARVALTVHTFRTVEPQVVVLFGKRWEFGDNREVWKAFACQYARPHWCCSWVTAEAKRCMPAPRRLHWPMMWSTHAEFAICRCQSLSASWPSLTERIFFAFAPISSLKT